jgi:eukaryotic-like serine/threonine-protein kinase
MDRRSLQSSASGPVTLPPELLAEAVRRLGWVALLYATGYTVAYFGPHLVAWVTTPGHSPPPAQTVVAVISVALGLAVFYLSRRDVLPAERLLDVGLAFEVVASLGISMAQFWQGLATLDLTSGKYSGIPWECLWIVIFPAVALNTPRKVLWASLAAATTGPITLFAAGLLGKPIGPSWVTIATFFTFRTFLCAGIAYVIGLVVYRYGVRLKKAGELGNYELVKRLGEGGMGEVWVGRHRMLARPAAVKLIRVDLLGNDPLSRETALKRFEREAMATAALRSAHTIHIYDFGITEDGAFFYVMEFLEGLNLETMVRRFGPLPPSRAVYLLRQVCHSLGEAHARGLIHRDVKPANIFSSRLGPDCDFVKVLDFGLVKNVSDTGRRHTEVTAQGVTTGTPAFMAPEVALARADVDARADIYALGCVAYWLVTGHHVFSGATAVATMIAHMNDTPVPPSARTEIPLPAALEALILDCIAKDPAARPQTVDDIVRRLDAIELSAWTPDDARRWWALHGPLGSLSAIAGQDLSAAAVVRAKR